MGVLSGAFLAAIVISSLLTNRGTADLTVDLGDPTLPRVSFTVAGNPVNALSGYVNEMDITAMRDTITPLLENGTLEMTIQDTGSDIQGAWYEVYSLDGEKIYKDQEIRDLSENVVLLDLNGVLGESVTEAVLKVSLKVKDKEIYFFTRIEKPDDLSVKQCLNFAENFHDKTFDKKNVEELSMYLEEDGAGDTTTYQTVTIHSSVSQVTWGTLAPEVSTEVEWSIKESNSVYTSLMAKYQVTCIGDKEEVETYNVKEFFRVRYNGDELYLLDYNRSMNQVFNGNKQVMDKEGIWLGITSSDVSYETNKNETIVSFVQERDLWTYDKKSDELSLVFSFANKEGHNVRSRNDQHDVRIISVDKDGSTTFAVYGYMNRGAREGQVGVDVYYFNKEKNAVEEKAFIPSNKSFAIAEDELGKMVYYSHERQMLYVLAEGKLYEVNLSNKKQKILAENLGEGQYAVSDDGHLIAYQLEGTRENSKEIKVLNLRSGDERIAEAKEGESIRPLGFISDDFVYGCQRAADKGVTVAGEEIFPMYQLEIRDTKNKVVKTYSSEGIYISDILVETNLATINRLTKEGEIYTGTSQDYISNNEERKESNILLESRSTDLKATQLILAYADGISDTSPKILRPKQVLLEEPITISFSGKVKTDKYYVYGMGELVGIYDKAAYAIQKAEQVSGVVISSEQSYIWEKGNRNLVYDTEAEPFKRGEDQTSLAACEEQMKKYDATKADLTGCTLEQVLYVISKGNPVIAMTSPQHAILLTGYTTTEVTYVEPDTGEKQVVSTSEMAEMVEGSGNTFIGYVK